MEIVLAFIPFTILIIGKLVIRRMDREIDKEASELMKRVDR